MYRVQIGGITEIRDTSNHLSSQYACILNYDDSITDY